MNKIKINTAEKELYYKGDIILRYQIEYPEMIYSDDEDKMNIFNYQNRKNALEIQEFAENELYEQAKEMYEYNKKNGYPNMIYELIKECNIT